MTIVKKMLKAKRPGSPTRAKTSSAITQLPTNMMKVRYQISTGRHTVITIPESNRDQVHQRKWSRPSSWYVAALYRAHVSRREGTLDHGSMSSR